MKVKCFMAVILMVTIASLNIYSQSDEFIYQGNLAFNGQPANGSYDFEFRLFSAFVNGTQINVTRTHLGVQVTNGHFAVSLLFDEGFDGSTRYLDISVRPAGGGAYTTLTPRTLIGTTPYAMRSTNALSAQNAVNAETAVSAQTAAFAENAGSAISATSADIATNATNAITAQTALQANTATTATNVSGVVSISNGGTGSSTKNFVDISTNQTNIAGNKTFSGILTGNGSGLTNVPGTLTWQTMGGTSISAVSNRGYVVTSSLLSTITLPSNPAIGDMIRVTGASSGGWKIAANTGQSIISRGVIPNAAWIPRGPNKSWFSVASSSDGVKLVAVANQDQIYVSNDSGINWSPRETNRPWISVASSADGSKLVALAEGGRIYTSNDAGVTWTPRDSNRLWRSVASSADGSKLVAVVNGGQIYTSTDSGSTWNPRETNRNWSSVASSSDGSKLVAVVTGGQIYTSTDFGISWSPRDANRGWQSVASSSDGVKLIAGAGESDSIYFSSNSGITWASSGLIGDWFGLSSSSDGTNMAGVSRGGRVYTSPFSGQAWLVTESNREWRSIASSSDGSKLVAVTGNDFSGNPYTAGRIYIKSPILSFETITFVEGASESTIELQFIGAGRFLVLSGSGPLAAY